MRIDSYRFGNITIEGTSYQHDVIIYPDRVESWWREEGHRVSLNDLKGALQERPSVLIIGTGASELLKVPADLQRDIESKGIRLLVEPTEAACHTYNRLFSEDRGVIAALHLTC